MYFRGLLDRFDDRCRRRHRRRCRRRSLLQLCCGGIVVARVACGHRSLWQATRNSSCGSTLTIVHGPIEKVSIQGCIVNAAWIICLWAAAGGGGQTGF